MTIYFKGLQTSITCWFLHVEELQTQVTLSWTPCRLWLMISKVCQHKNSLTSRYHSLCLPASQYMNHQEIFCDCKERIINIKINIFSYLKLKLISASVPATGLIVGVVGQVRNHSWVTTRSSLTSSLYLLILCRQDFSPLKIKINERNTFETKLIIPKLWLIC